MTRKSKARNYHNPGQNNGQHATMARYNRAIKLNPSDDEAYFNRGLAYYKIKNYSRAIADYTQALELNSSYAKAYYNHGLAHEALQDYSRAIADFDHALALNPSIVNSYGRYIYPKLEEDQPNAAGLDRAFEQNISVLTWPFYFPQSEE